MLMALFTHCVPPSPVRVWRSAQGQATVTLRRCRPSWRRCLSSSTSAWTWPMATQNILSTLSKTSGRSSLHTPSWWGHVEHILWTNSGWNGFIIFYIYIVFVSGGKCGDRRDGRGAHLGRCWHHQSRHRTRWDLKFLMLHWWLPWLFTRLHYVHKCPI